MTTNHINYVFDKKTREEYAGRLASLPKSRWGIIREKALSRIKGCRISHNWPLRIKDGAKVGMYEQEITNYDGYGPSIVVYGRTPEEAVEMAKIITQKLSANN